jgi:hypothetical protein
VEGGRRVLRSLLAEPFRFTPVVDRKKRGYRFTATIALDRVVSGVIELPQTLGGIESPQPPEDAKSKLTADPNATCGNCGDGSSPTGTVERCNLRLRGFAT